MDTKPILNNKRLIVFIINILSITLTFAGLAIFSLFELNKFVGLGVGVGTIIIAAVIALTVKKTAYIPVIFANSIAIGIAISSMYSHFEYFPPVWQLSIVALGTAVLFAIFCLLTKTPLFSKHHIICAIVFLLLVLTAEILITIFVSPYVFGFALFLILTLTAHVLALSARAKDRDILIRNLTLCSFTVLLLAIIIVFIIITEGDGAELAEVLVPDTASARNKKTNQIDPYAFQPYEPLK